MIFTQEGANMLKTILHFSAKIFLGFGTYLLLLLAGILSVVEVIFKMISHILERLPNALIAFGICMAVALTIGFLGDGSMLQEGWREYTIVIMWVVIGVVSWLISFLGPVVASVIQLCLAFLNPAVLSTWLSFAAKFLADTYLNLENGEAEPWISIISFPYIVTEYAALLLGLTVKATACIGSPLLLSWLGYRAIFEGTASIDKGSTDWWLCIVFIALCGLLGLYLGIAASQSVMLNEEDKEDT